MPSKKFFDIVLPKKTQEPEREIFQLKTKSLSISKKISILCFLLFCALVFFLHLGAKAEIEIWPKTEPVFVEENLFADVEVSQSDFSKKTIPAIFFSKEKAASQEFVATGILEKEGRASGKITVYNNYHLPQTLVVKTRFISAEGGGKLFYSKKTVHIPPGEHLDVEVEAAEPGPEYNIKPSVFAIPGLQGTPRYTAVHGESSSPMKGGFIGQVSQVTKKDLEKAKNDLYSHLASLLETELRNTAGPLFLLLEEAIQNETLESSCSKEAGEEAEKFTCSLRLRADSLGVLESDLKDFARKSILQKTPGKKIKEDSLEIEPFVEKTDFETKKLALKLKIKAEIFSDIDTDLLKKRLQGKSLEESEILLKDYSEIEKTKIRIFPPWKQRVPQDLKKIKVRLSLD